MTHEEKVDAFSEGYLRELDARVARSELTGTIVLKDRSVALFFDRTTGKFTLLEKTGEDAAVTVFDAIPREQWGRLVMVFGHETQAGGFVASGHGTLTGDQFTIRLANGRYYRLTVDAAQAHMAPYFVARNPEQTKPAPAARDKRPAKRETKERSRPVRAGGEREEGPHSDEHEDFTHEDLARLRGEIPMASKKAKRRH